MNEEAKVRLLSTSTQFPQKLSEGVFRLVGQVFLFVMSGISLANSNSIGINWPECLRSSLKTVQREKDWGGQNGGFLLACTFSNHGQRLLVFCGHSLDGAMSVFKLPPAHTQSSFPPCLVCFALISMRMHCKSHPGTKTLLEHVQTHVSGLILTLLLLALA